VKTVCPRCERKLRNANAWHYCQKVSIDELFIGKPDEVVLCFDAILQQIAEWDDVEITATKNCVVCVRNQTFLVMKPMKTCLEVKFYAPEFIDDDRLHKCSVWNRKYQGILRLTHEKQLHASFIHYFQHSYAIS
jgi:hypothetical protein